jgi:hypothetical protein
MMTPLLDFTHWDPPMGLSRATSNPAVVVAARFFDDQTAAWFGQRAERVRIELHKVQSAKDSVAGQGRSRRGFLA